MTRVAAVRYLNTIPMLKGIADSEIAANLDIILEHPANCARLFVDRKVDIALCPVGALFDISNYEIVSSVGIGCMGEVRTVAVYSHSPIEEIRAIKLYGESRSSNLLVQVLDAHFWQQDLRFIPQGGVNPYPDRLTGHLFIGDICFIKEQEFAYKTDLGAEWYRFTGLPFLFAAWVAHEKVSLDFTTAFDSAMQKGISNISAMEIPDLGCDIDGRSYLLQNIRYNVDRSALNGMKRFFDLANELKKTTRHVGQVASR